MRQTTFAASAARRFVALGLVPMLIVGVFASLYMADLQRGSVEWRNRLMAQTVSSEVEAFLDTPAAALGQLKGVRDQRVADALVRSLAENIEFIESVLLVDDTGRVIAAGVGLEVPAREADLIGLDRSRDPQLLESSSTGKVAWSGVYTSAVSGQRCVQLAVPLDDRTALATVVIESLERYTDHEEFGPDVTTIVVDRTGRVLFHSDDAVAAQRPNLRNLRPVSESLAGRTGSFRYTHDEEDTFGSTAAVDGTGWTVLVQQNWADAVRPIDTVLLWLGIATAIVALVAGVGAVLFARDLWAPISRLQSFTRAVKEGDYGADPGSYRHRELDVLAASIREMSEAVRDRQHDLARTQEDLRRSNDELAGLVRASANAMGRIVEARDPYTQGHQQRVSVVAAAIAQEMGMSDDDVEGLEMAGIIHDIGKLAIPAEILLKPGELTDIEFALVKAHPQQGYAILKDIPFPWPVSETVLQHHERLDGSGYPAGLKGDEICATARILAVADVVEAMASHRPYRAAFGLDVALAELAGNADRYDVDVVSALIRLHESGRLPL